MVMGSPLSLIVSNIFMGHFGKLLLDSSQHKPLLWLQYIDDVFVICPYGPDRLQDFLRHLNSLSPSYQFTMEIVSDSAVPFLDVLLIRKQTTMATKVYRIPTNSGR
jgi:hypothetical protein